MGNAPLVSIAMCTYNGVVYLQEQLDSLVEQTYPNLEIVIVDDGSRDESIAIINKYTNRYKNIRLIINDTNLGYSRNFEKAIGLCKGDLIALCDQDDIWDREKIAIMVEHIGDHVLIYHDSLFIDEEGRSLDKKISDIRNCYSGSDARVFLFENCVSGHAMLFRKDLINLASGFRPEIAHDWWLAYIATNTGSILFLDKALVQYRQHRSASTDILRQKTKLVKKLGSIEKLDRQLYIFRAFSNFSNNKYADFTSGILRLMENRVQSYFSFTLFAAIAKNHKVLLYIQRKPAISKFNFILKFLWGYKLKMLFRSE